MTALFIIDICSIVGLSVSGAVVASRKGFDWFGISAMGFLTAVGGGTIRDILIGATPAWIITPAITYGAIIGVVFTIAAYKFVLKMHKALTLFDAFGISLAGIAGAAKSLEYGASVPAAIILGVVSCTLGGVIRDTICNEVPLIFRKEIYATACIAGIVLYIVLLRTPLNGNVTLWASSAVIFIVRILAVKFKIGLPGIKATSSI